ncbi:hypothetical protein [Priestia megaterium]|uniref:hypothetical protein n=1 Tax=Priestia megaterium TaxID=1404 RepID=UPI002B24BCF9|nr:hypothetical protein [Priestia megaterium]MEB2294514.1 hypothetical protein [Priestia megaterium]
MVELKQLIINDAEFNVENFEEKTITHSPTGEQLKKIGFAFSVIGKKDYNLYDFFFESPHFELTIVDTNEKLKMKNISHSTFYQAAEISDDTKIVFRIKLQQEPAKEKELTKDQKLMVNAVNEVVLSRVRFKALKEILEEKGLIKGDELFDKIEKVAKRDFDTLKKELLQGKEEINT